MSSSIPGPTDALPPVQWLDGGHGRLAFFPFPAERCWLHVAVSHGFGEHSGWWAHVAEALRRVGISAYLFDHYHHGRSAGVRADVQDYATLVAGLRLALEQGVAPHRGDGAPLVLLAHSNGALVALSGLEVLRAARVEGLVLCSPYLGMTGKLALGGSLLAGLLRLFSPTFRVPLATRPQRLTSRRALWPAYLADPLRFRGITVRYFLAMRRALAGMRQVRSLGGLPLLVLAAGDERVVSAGAMRDWYARMEPCDKQWRDFPSLRHELFNEVAWESVLEEVVAWCRARFQRRTPGGDPQ
jgi:alpha-beta hydrolase superfamily lysophospholipase